MIVPAVRPETVKMIWYVVPLTSVRSCERAAVAPAVWRALAAAWAQFVPVQGVSTVAKSPLVMRSEPRSSIRR